MSKKPVVKVETSMMDMKTTVELFKKVNNRLFDFVVVPSKHVANGGVTVILQTDTKDSVPKNFKTSVAVKGAPKWNWFTFGMPAPRTIDAPKADESATKEATSGPDTVVSPDVPEMASVASQESDLGTYDHADMIFRDSIDVGGWNEDESFTSAMSVNEKILTDGTPRESEPTGVDSVEALGFKRYGETSSAVGRGQTSAILPVGEAPYGMDTDSTFTPHLETMASVVHMKNMLIRETLAKAVIAKSVSDLSDVIWLNANLIENDNFATDLVDDDDLFHGLCALFSNHEPQITTLYKALCEERVKEIINKHKDMAIGEE